MAAILATIGVMEEKNDNYMEAPPGCASLSRTERRKEAKKEKRKKKRKETAETARIEAEARVNDPDEQLRLQAEEERQKERMETEIREFEEREKVIQEVWAKKRAMEVEKEEKRRRDWEEEQSKLNQSLRGQEIDEDGYEYVEEGPPEIIWQGNEIIVKKKKVLKKKDSTHQMIKEVAERPTSNPLPPQSEAFSDYKSTSILSAQQILENVAQQTPNFGTEQDKAHCPFHLKTGVCRFGSRCSRIHFYPDKSCTMLIKNMYNGPGLAWEQDEGLECNWEPLFLGCWSSAAARYHLLRFELEKHTDEEVECSYEEFYEDVHTEFLKFGEIVNFKVCRNASSHLRGNVYVHYKTEDSAELAYHSVNGRYFGGKQLQCEFVGVTRWKVAICGEYMKSKLMTCSRGITCNFIHCFRNPGGDYEWADWDKPPPGYWVKKMASLFGYSDESGYYKEVEYGSPRLCRNPGRISSDKKGRDRSQRSQSRETDHSKSSRNQFEHYSRRSYHRLRQISDDRKQLEFLDEEPREKRPSSRKSHNHNKSSGNSDSERDCLDRESAHRRHGISRRRGRYCNDKKLKSQGDQFDGKNTYESSLDTRSFDNDMYDHVLQDEHPRKSIKHLDKRTGTQDEVDASPNCDSLDKDSDDKTLQSGKMNARLPKKPLASLDDDGNERMLIYRQSNGNLSDEARKAEILHAYGTKFSRYDMEKPKNKKLRKSNAHSIEDEISEYHLGREHDEEAGQANTGPKDLVQKYALSSDSISRYHSRKVASETGLEEYEEPSPRPIKKSKRKRDGNNSRSSDHRGKRSRPSEYQIDEEMEERGRWEPDYVSGDT